MKLASYLGYRSIGVPVDNNRIHLFTGPAFRLQSSSTESELDIVIWKPPPVISTIASFASEPIGKVLTTNSENVRMAYR
jgi:hypothetical protein